MTVESSNISVVIVTHLGGQLLVDCVNSIKPQIRQKDELFVVVSSEPNTADLEGVCANFIKIGSNVGFARAANEGIRASSCTGVLILNDDTVAEQTLLDSLRPAMKTPGIYQPKIMLADGSGRLDNTGHGLYPDGFNWAIGREDLDGDAYDLPREVGACSGAAMLIHRSVIECVGVFDESFHSFGEDVDLSLRAKRAGFVLRYVPEAKISHHLGASYGRYGLKKLFWIERNRVRGAFRSMPASLLLTMPLWTATRVLGLSAASATGRTWGARVQKRGGLAAVAGIVAGVYYIPSAIVKRRRDSVSWVLGERQMLRSIYANRVRLVDVFR
jgi:GT2 family glycosyltransferase